MKKRHDIRTPSPRPARPRRRRGAAGRCPRGAPRARRGRLRRPVGRRCAAGIPWTSLRRASRRFDVLPFNECSDRSCALVRTRAGAIAARNRRPVSQQSWRAGRPAPRAAPFACASRTARPSTYSRATGDAEGARRSEGGHRRRRRRGTRPPEDLSLKAISDEKSESCRLVRSTLRDA